MMKMTTKHPWQTVPAELIAHAMEYLRRDTEFDHRIAFLLLDLGVETLLRTFLSLPEAVTGAQSERSHREKAAKGSFPGLLVGVKAAAPERIADGAIGHISRYHSHRNKLYHLNYMESVLCENDPDLWEAEVDVLDWYWVVRDFVAETRGGGEPATAEQIGTCERLRANLEATRERLPNWLSKAGVVKDRDGECDNDVDSRAAG